MNYYFLLISLVLVGASSIFSITRQLQMLQQNSYFPSRYSGWLKDNLPLADVLLFFISSILFVFKLYIPQMIFCALVLLFRIPKAISFQKKSIKKLVFTARIKRLFAAAFIIEAALITVYALFPEKLGGIICMDLEFMLSYITPILVYLIWLVTFPVEKGVSAWYVGDAKKRLKAHSGLKVIGITGSYGKTTTKFILTRILSEKFNVVCTPQSFNTPMGVVRTVRESLKPQTQVFVCEMGAKNVGDIKEICKIANPDYGIITSVGEQHLETFESVDNVFKTKFELADWVKNKGGTIFANGDSEEIKNRIDSNEFEIYGCGKNAKYTISDITSGRDGSSFELSLSDTALTLTTKLLGKHSIVNIAGAAALAYSLGVDPRDIAFAVASLKPTEHRLELKNSVNRSLLIDDAYNANPEGSIEAVNVLASFEGMKKVIITPGLIELGNREKECNYNLGVACGRACDVVILVGKNRSKPIADGVKSTDFNTENLHIVSSFKEAMEIYSTFADSNTCVLLENDLPDNYLN